MNRLLRAKWQRFFQWLAITVSVAWVYGPAMRGDFIWDDRTYILQSALMKAQDGLSQIWSTNRMSDFWPLSYSLYWLMLQLFGTIPLGYHLVGIALHVTTVILLWRLLSSLKVRYAYVSALLFALHPVCVESVAWIIESKTTLASSLALGCALLYSHSRSPRDWRYAASLVLFLGAMLAKAAVAPWPCILLLIKIWQRRSVRLTKIDLVSIVPFLAVTIIVTGLNLHWYAAKVDFDVASEAIRDDSLLSRLAIGGKAFWFYLGKALLPVHLAFIYPRWTVYDPPPLSHFVPLAAVLASAGLLGYAACKKPRFLGASLLFAYVLLMLAPVLGLYDVYQMRYTFVTDHWFYYGLMGVTTAMAVGFDWITCRWASLGRMALLVTGILFGWLAHTHAKNFRDEETVWRATLEQNPDSWMVHKTLGLVLKLQGRMAEAEAAYREAIRLKPQAETLYNLAIILEGRNDFQRALDLYLEAIKLNPYHWAIYNNLGSVQVRLGLTGEAIDSFKKGLSLHPSYVTHFNLGLLLDETGDTATARQHFLEAKKLSGNDAEELTIDKHLNKIGSQMQK